MNQVNSGTSPGGHHVTLNRTSEPNIDGSAVSPYDGNAKRYLFYVSGTYTSGYVYAGASIQWVDESRVRAMNASHLEAVPTLRIEFAPSDAAPLQGREFQAPVRALWMRGADGKDKLTYAAARDSQGKDAWSLLEYMREMLVSIPDLERQTIREDLRRSALVWDKTAREFAAGAAIMNARRNAL